MIGGQAYRGRKCGSDFGCSWAGRSGSSWRLEKVGGLLRLTSFVVNRCDLRRTLGSGRLGGRAAVRSFRIASMVRGSGDELGARGDCRGTGD